MGKAYNPPAGTRGDEWTTPEDFFARLDEEFHFRLDAAASPYNAKCDNYFTKGIPNAFDSDWNKGPTFCNPPYGRVATSAWLTRGWQQHQEWGETIVFLVPASTETRWFHQAAQDATEIRLIKGRLKFGNVVCKDGSMGEQAAQFPSALIVYMRRRPVLWPRPHIALIRAWDWRKA